jgi:hypothetical protein
MFAISHLLAAFIADLFKPRHRLEVENLFLRHQLNIALRRSPKRLRLQPSDRALVVWMTRMWPSLLGLAQVVQPATILRWHRSGFRAYLRWKSRSRPGRPRVGQELRDLIRRMSEENPLWGAPRIHGELLKLGFKIAESTASNGAPSRTAIPDLANIPAQSCGSHCGDRSLRGSHRNLRAPVCLSRSGPWTSTAAMVCGDPESNRGVAGSTGHGGIPVDNGTDLFGARQ